MCATVQETRKPRQTAWVFTSFQQAMETFREQSSESPGDVGIAVNETGLVWLVGSREQVEEVSKMSMETATIQAMQAAGMTTELIEWELRDSGQAD